MSEQVLNNQVLASLRNNSLIAQNEIVISEGDLYYAKNVLTNERRIIDSSVVKSFTSNESITETKKTLLKG